MSELEREILTHIFADVFWFGVFLSGVALIRHGLEGIRQPPRDGRAVLDPRQTGRGARDWKTFTR